jgi:D-Tyr-tRNAtyr deacylase
LGETPLVQVEGQQISAIGAGWLCLIGITLEDGEQAADTMSVHGWYFINFLN